MKKVFILILATVLLLGSIQITAAEDIPSLKEIYSGKFDFGAAAPQAAFQQPEKKN